MSRHDARNFSYPLEAVMQRRRWLQDAAQGRLSRVRAMIDSSRAERASLVALQDSQYELVRTDWETHRDPDRHSQSLVYLAALKRQQDDIERCLAGLETDLVQATQDWVARQRDVEVLTRDREESLRKHGVESARRDAAEADRQHLARTPPTGRAP